MSFFFKLSDVSPPPNVSLTVFRPSLSSQLLLIKGDLGLFSFFFSSSLLLAPSSSSPLGSLFVLFHGSFLDSSFFGFVSWPSLLFSSSSFSSLSPVSFGLFSPSFSPPSPPSSSLFSFLSSFFVGVSQGFSVSLELKGLGFHASVLHSPPSPSSGLFLSPLPSSGPFQFLFLSLGRSHPFFYPFSHVLISIFGPSSDSFVTLSIFGISKFLVHQVAADLYSLKKPDPYKGKGFRYDGFFFLSKSS